MEDKHIISCLSPQMTTIPDLDMRSLDSLDRLQFFIPSQQRGYRWTVKNIYELVEDLIDFRHSASHRYCLQPLAVVDAESRYHVLDGQQRLTSIYILMKSLNIDSRYYLDFERDANVKKSRRELLETLESLMEVNDETIDYYHITRAFLALKSLFDGSVDVSLDKNDMLTRDQIIGKLKDIKDGISNQEWLKSLLKGTAQDKKIEFIWYQVPRSEAHKVFRNLNSGKIELGNSDLIKALLLSDSSYIPAEKRGIVAIQLENMQRAMKDDRLWHMLQWQDFRRSGYRMTPVDPKDNSGYIAIQNRIDLIFNIVSGVSLNRYLSDALSSFRYYYDHRENLCEIWNRTCKYFLIIKGLYENPITYHYCGVLTFFHRKSAASYKHIGEWISWQNTMPKNEVIDRFRGEIKRLIKGRSEEKYELPHYSGKNHEPVRRVLLLHNVESIISLYREKSSDKNLRLKAIYEVFPFDLLYRQSWDIEHVSSQSVNDLKKAEDREVWVRNFRQDYHQIFECELPEKDKDKKDTDTLVLDFTVSEIKDIRSLYDSYEGTDKIDDKKKAFERLYRYVVTKIDEHLKGDEITDKDCIGNLVLLDSHTNRSFHNALYPTKRRIVLEANGGIGERHSDDEKLSAKLTFIPLCTRHVFTKYYTAGPGISLSAWTDTDCINYQKDIEEKLKYYIE